MCNRGRGRLAVRTAPITGEEQAREQAKREVSAGHRCECTPRNASQVSYSGDSCTLRSVRPTSSDFYRQYGPWALVAGASEGIGRAFALELAARGLSLVLAARRDGPLLSLAREIEARFAVKARTVTVDLAQADLIAALAQATADLEIGLVVYNAAYAPIGSFLAIDLAQHERSIDLNCRGPLALSHHYGSSMAARGRGGLILMSSMSGLQGTALLSTYAATKAFDTVLAEGLWAELKTRGVHVLACVAGATRTPEYERTQPQDAGSLARPMEAEQVALEALAGLGHGPTLIPGRLNRAVASAMRLVSRGQATRFISNATRRMYGAR